MTHGETTFRGEEKQPEVHGDAFWEVTPIAWEGDIHADGPCPAEEGTMEPCQTP